MGLIAFGSVSMLPLISVLTYMRNAIQLGRKRWAIESFFKTIKHRFGLHRFGQSTKLGVYRWLILSLLAQPAVGVCLSLSSLD
ncbi:MAG: hypothetical protein DCF22_13240 [Leptolyngbya sp.]|nr:MAG: hypothetical protein DCF22_13240 [Leptolyngbya sp.]